MPRRDCKRIDTPFLGARVNAGRAGSSSHPRERGDPAALVRRLPDSPGPALRAGLDYSAARLCMNWNDGLKGYAPDMTSSLGFTP